MSTRRAGALFRLSTDSVATRRRGKEFTAQSEVTLFDRRVHRDYTHDDVSNRDERDEPVCDNSAALNA